MNPEVQKIQELASLIGNNDLRQYPVQELIARFASYEEQFRYDQVVRNVQQVLEKKAFDNPNTIVSAEELSQIANHFASLGSTDNFKVVAADLLPEVVVQEGNKQEQHLEANRHIYTEDGVRSPETEAALEIDENESLQLDVPNTYAKVFDKGDSKYGYLKTPELIGRGQYLVEDELRGLGHIAKVNYTTCNTDTLLFAAAIDTDFGKQRIFIPVEMADEQVLYPTSFATNEKIYELSKQGFNHFLGDKKAGFFNEHVKFADGIRDNMLTDTIREMTNDSSVEVDENTYLDDKVVMPKELIPVEQILEDTIIRKESEYSNEQIDMAIASVREEITRCGYQSELKFIGDIKEGLNVAASVQTPEGKLAVQIPVEVTNEGGVLFPSKFVPAGIIPGIPDGTGPNSEGEGEDCTINNEGRPGRLGRPGRFPDGTGPNSEGEDCPHKHNDEKVTVTVGLNEYKLSKEGFAEYIANNQEDVLPFRYSGEMIGLDFNALRRAVYQSVRQQRYTIAEAALNVIADKYGEDSHASTMEDYKEWLLNKSLDFNDNFGLGMRASTDGIKEPGWEGEIVTSQIKMT